MVLWSIFSSECNKFKSHLKTREVCVCVGGWGLPLTQCIIHYTTAAPGAKRIFYSHTGLANPETD